MQSGKREKRRGGLQIQCSLGAMASAPNRGVPGDPWIQTTTWANKQQRPVPADFHRLSNIWSLSDKCPQNVGFLRLEAFPMLQVFPRVTRGFGEIP